MPPAAMPPESRSAPEQPVSDQSLLQRRPCAGSLLLGTVLAALGLLGAGVWLPAMTIEKFVLVEHTYSILGGVLELWREGEWLLFALVGGFSLLLPLLKLGLLALLCLRPDGGRGRLIGWLERIGRWSMLDVFVVAVLVASVQLGVVATVHVHAGLYAFAGSVLLTMLASGGIHRLQPPT